MPKRLVDGEALWRSNKLLSVSPKFRSEYANLIPLAEADGTFQADARKVWSEVYSYNREDIAVGDVEMMLREFESAGMLERKKDEKGVIWGKFIGIESRLPPESHRDRYKHGNTNIFNNVAKVQISSGFNPDNGEGEGVGLDKDRNGIGKEGRFKNIAIRYSSFFGVSHSHNKKHLDRYQQVCQKYGEDKVLEMFDRWAPSVDWLREKRDANGLNLFWRPLEELIAGDELSAERNKPVERKEVKTFDPLTYDLPATDLTPEQQKENAFKI